MRRISAQEIKLAREVLVEVEIVKNKTVENEYRGYISSFGASIAQSGLVPSVAFYENKNTNSKQDKYRVMQAILRMLKKEKEEYDTLLDYLIDREQELDTLQLKIIHYASALKLAMNTFKKAEGQSYESA